MTAPRSLAERAALNNARWCDSVCRAHGSAGDFAPGAWLHRRASPPFYPNLVTLRDTADHTAVLRHIDALVGLPLPGRWGVKDSFCRLDLHVRGFELLFEASWIWRVPIQDTQPAPDGGIRWQRVASAAALQAWKTAWAEAHLPEPAAAPHQPPFPAALLSNPDVAFLAGLRGNRMVAGTIVNRSDDEIGVSNVFAAEADEQAAWAGLTAAAHACWPALPLVGYESGRSLDSALACGWTPAGPLRVWLRHDRPPA